MLRLTLEDGSTVFVEPLSPPRTPVPASKAKRAAEEVQELLDASISSIGLLAQRLREGLDGHLSGEFDAELEFGISFTAEADLVLVRGSAEASARVTLKWSK